MLTITKIDDASFSVTHTDAKVPPLTLGVEDTRQFAIALSKDHPTPFGIDHNIWAPLKGALGLWISPAGELSVWLQGENVVIKPEEGKALATDLLLSAVKFQVGTEVELIENTQIFVNAADSYAPCYEPGIVERIDTDAGGKVVYFLKTSIGTTTSIGEEHLRIPMSNAEFKVTQVATQIVERTVVVSARDVLAARIIGHQQFNAMPLGSGWIPQDENGYVTITSPKPGQLAVEFIGDTTAEEELDLGYKIVGGKLEGDFKPGQIYTAALGGCPRAKQALKILLAI